MLEVLPLIIAGMMSCRSLQNTGSATGSAFSAGPDNLAKGFDDAECLQAVNIAVPVIALFNVLRQETEHCLFTVAIF